MRYLCEEVYFGFVQFFLLFNLEQLLPLFQLFLLAAFVP